MNPRPWRSTPYLLATLVVLTMMSLQFSERATTGAVAVDSDDPVMKEMQTFAEAYRLVQQEYYDTSKIVPKDLIAGAIRGMLGTLGDPHTRFLPPVEARDLTLVTQGEFGGIGIHIGMENDRLSVIAPVEGTPAWRAHLESGDIIAKINGDTTDGMSLDDAVTKLRGTPGTKVVLTIERRGFAKPIEVPITREVIEIHTVRHTVFEGFGYIRISEFSEKTANDLDKSLRALSEKNVPGIILDLRDNSGGVLDGAIAVSNRFLDSGTIVSIISRHREQTMTYTATPTPTMTRVPIVILVNGISASASEIVAGALRDSNRAVLVGTKTYGKGSVQTVEELPEDAKLALTTARYFTPSGRSIHGVGIEPDVEVKMPEISDTDRKALGQLLDTDLVREFARGKSSYDKDDVEALGGIVKRAGIAITRDVLEWRLVRELARRNENKMFLIPHLDPQLRKAVEILRGEAKTEPRVVKSVS